MAKCPFCKADHIGEDVLHVVEHLINNDRPEPKPRQMEQRGAQKPEPRKEVTRG